MGVFESQFETTTPRSRSGFPTHALVPLCLLFLCDFRRSFVATTGLLDSARDFRASSIVVRRRRWRRRIHTPRARFAGEVSPPGLFTNLT